MNLKIVEIRDAGKKRERIFMRADGYCNLNNYLVYDETFDEEGNPSNLLPHMHRFDPLQLNEGEYVLLYTQGNPANNRKGTFTDCDDVCYYLHWGLDETIFNQEGDTIHLIKIDDEDESSYEE